MGWLDRFRSQDLEEDDVQCKFCGSNDDGTVSFKVVNEDYGICTDCFYDAKHSGDLDDDDDPTLSTGLALDVLLFSRSYDAEDEHDDDEQ